MRYIINFISGGNEYHTTVDADDVGFDDGFLRAFKGDMLLGVWRKDSLVNCFAMNDDMRKAGLKE